MRKIFTSNSSDGLIFKQHGSLDRRIQLVHLQGNHETGRSHDDYKMTWSRQGPNPNYSGQQRQLPDVRDEPWDPNEISQVEPPPSDLVRANAMGQQDFDELMADLVFEKNRSGCI